MTEEAMSSLLLEDLMLLFLPSLSFSLSLSLGSCESAGKGKQETKEEVRQGVLRGRQEWEG